MGLSADSLHPRAAVVTREHGVADDLASAGKMRLLVLEPDPSHGGGSESVLLSLSRELAGRGHLVFLLHDAEGSMLPEYRQFVAQTVRRPLPGFAMRSPARTVACVFRIARVARELGVDAIISSHLGFIRHCALVRLIAGIPSCFHLGLPFEGASFTLRLATGHVGHGIAPSSHTARTWGAAGWPSSSLHQVQNWVDPERFCPAVEPAALRRGIGIPGDIPCVVFVGRVCEQKGVDILIRAFAGVAAAIPNVTLIIVGPVDIQYQARMQESLGLLDEPVRQRVLLRGATSTPERYYAAADVVCAPSLGDEAFGLSVLEAMACGVPVVTTMIGIIPEILGEGTDALLVRPGDVDGLTERLIHWLQLPDERIVCGKHLRDRVIHNYGPASSIDRYEAILAKLALKGAATCETVVPRPHRHDGR